MTVGRLAAIAALPALLAGVWWAAGEVRADLLAFVLRRWCDR